MKKAVQILSATLLALCFYVFVTLFNRSVNVFLLPTSTAESIDFHKTAFFLSVAVLLCGGLEFFTIRKKSKIFCLLVLVACFFACFGALWIYGSNMLAAISADDYAYYVWQAATVAVPMAAAEIIDVILFIMTAIKPKTADEKEKAKEKKKQRLQDKIDKLK